MDSVVLKNVTKKFKNGDEDLVILDNADYVFHKKRFYSLIGRSGLGKTTLVNLIGTISGADNGSIIINGNNLANISEKKLTEIRRNNIGFIFQNFSLIERYSVLENLELPLYFFGIKDKIERQKKIKSTIELVGISSNNLTKKVQFLSGGEKQRVAICRALLNSPSVILADEPTGNLDEVNEQNIMRIFLYIKEISDSTIIMVTHNKKIAKAADTVITLNKGKIVETEIE